MARFCNSAMTQIRNGSIVMSKHVRQHTTVKKAIHLVSVILEDSILLKADCLVRHGQQPHTAASESTTTVEIQLGMVKESGASPVRLLSCALSQDAALGQQ